MKRWIAGLLGVYILIAVVFFIQSCGPQPQVCLDHVCFNVEIADSAHEQVNGLMHRKHMPWNSGMLFTFNEEKIHSFWMKNTFLALDIIWLDSAYNVVYIERGAQPCQRQACPSYTPDTVASYVLEVNAGALPTDAQVGDKAAIIGLE